MDRIEFIDELKRCLKGKVDDAELQRQIDYYTSYIISECSTGVKEDVVIEALGDPRLIAKTIVQTYNMNDNPIKNQYQGYQEFREEDQADVPEHVFARKARRFITIGIIVLVLLAVVSIIFSIVRFLLPITITFIMIWFLFSIIMRLFQGK